jgi:hypothetical protein
MHQLRALPWRKFWLVEWVAQVALAFHFDVDWSWNTLTLFMPAFWLLLNDYFANDFLIWETVWRYMVARWKLDDTLMTHIDRYSLFTRSNAANSFDTRDFLNHLPSSIYFPK